MLSIALATTNRGKIREFERLLRDVPVRLVSLAELGVAVPIETGARFIENAQIKARHAVIASGMPALADDSGLAVDALGGRPGIFSARFAGVDADDAANRERVLVELEAVPLEGRSAHFHCALVLAAPDGDDARVVIAVEAAVAGTILPAPRGSQGFGYDPLFFLPGLGLTFAEMSETQKSQHSHRAIAVRQALPALLAFARQKPGSDFARRDRAEA